MVERSFDEIYEVFTGETRRQTWEQLSSTADVNE